MECVQIDQIASPGDRLTIYREFHTDHAIDRAGGSMFARDPFRVIQGEGTGGDRDAEMRMQQLSGYLGRINLKSDWQRRGAAGSGCLCRQTGRGDYKGEGNEQT